MNYPPPNEDDMTAKELADMCMNEELWTNYGHPENVY